MEKVKEDFAIDVDYHKNRYGFPLSNSEILNFLTHREVWKKLLQTDESWCMIIENNVNIYIEYRDIIDTINELPDDWELFFPYDPYEYHETLHQKSNASKFLVNPDGREMWNLEPYMLGYQWENSIYFISRKGAEKLLDINVIRQRLDDEILMQVDLEKLTVFTGTVDWFDYKQIIPVVFKDRNQLIWKTICENSTWTPVRKKAVRDLLKVISDTANYLNIDLVLQGGTHLGYIRHGGIMPWDDDVDIGIEENKLQAFFNRLSEIDGICFGEVVEQRTGVPFYKIWDKAGESIDNCHYTFPFVDIWLFNRIGNDLVFKNGIICPNSASFDLIEVIFEGSPFKIPYNSIEVLDARYKDWKKKIRVFAWSHRYESNHFMPLILDIEVDDTGRLVSQFD